MREQFNADLLVLDCCQALVGMMQSWADDEYVVHVVMTFQNELVASTLPPVSFLIQSSSCQSGQYSAMLWR